MKSFLTRTRRLRFIYLLLSGIVRVSYINSHERQTIVSLLPAGELFGIDSLIPQAHHAFRCEAFDGCDHRVH